MKVIGRIPKCKRLTTRKRTPIKQTHDENSRDEEPEPEQVVPEPSTPRSRLKGALLDALEPAEVESDTSLERTPRPKRATNYEPEESSTEEEDNVKEIPSKKTDMRTAYVLKLFDRSVDLSQFEENTPLYPICRAWMINRPKAVYKKIGKRTKKPEPTLDSVELPGPEGPVVSRIPELLPEQKEAHKDNINLDYNIYPPPPLTALLDAHVARWASVRRAWIASSNAVEARYEGTAQLLNKINVNAL